MEVIAFLLEDFKFGPQNCLIFVELQNCGLADGFTLDAIGALVLFLGVVFR